MTRAPSGSRFDLHGKSAFLKGAIFVLVMLAWSGVAWGQDSSQQPEQVPPGADQYRESVPTASGPKSSGSGSGNAELPQEVEQVIEEITQQAPRAAPTLKRIARSEQYGAPQERLPDEGGTVGASSPVDTVDTVDAVTSAGTPAVGLLILLGLVAVAGIALALLRHRRTRTPKSST